MAEGLGISVPLLDRGLDQPRGRRRAAGADARSKFLHRVRRHRKPGQRHAGVDAEEAEYKAGAGRRHSQDLPRRHVVTAGFILGFDSEKGSIADAMIECIDATAIPVCMVGLLYALPNTQLTRRLAREERLYAPEYVTARAAKQGSGDESPGRRTLAHSGRG